MSEPVVISKIEDSVAWLTLNRPDKRNALNDEVIAALDVALRRAESSEAVRVVVISGSGHDFCSGADLAALQKISQATVVENQEDARSLMELFQLIRRLRVPVIAAVRGRALAGGCGLATACDIVLASDSARFGYPEVKIGFVPAIVTTILRRNISEKRAFELVVRGDEIQAETAERIGLINRVFRDDVFEEEIKNYVRSFARVSKSAATLTKQLLYQIDGMAFDEALQTGADVNLIARLTEDCQQGIASFFNQE